MVAQGLLASAIAGALGSFFDINESMVESKLLNKKKITLTNLRLKPRVVRRSESYVIELHGKIKQGLFQWKWSGKGLLKGCTFTLEGLRVTLKPGSPDSELSRDNDVELEKQRSSNQKKKRSPMKGSMKKEEGEGGREGWKAKLVNNIVEQLKVTVEDFELVIEAPRNSQEEEIPWRRQVRITGRNIELESLGRLYPKGMFRNARVTKRNYVTTPLLQDLSIGSLAADVVTVDTNGNAQAYPLLHPFQYLARAKRMFGKRFSGFASGLEVEGLEILNSQQFIRPTLKESGSYGAYESIRCGAENVGVYVDEYEIETSLCSNQLLNMSHSVSWDFDAASSVIESRDEVDVEGGNRLQASSEFYLVLGYEQLKGLFGIISLFADKPDPLDTQNNENGNYRDSYVGPGGLKQLNKISPMNFGKSTRYVNKASKFDLPLTSLHVILPNNTSVHAEKCKLELRTDDSLARIVGAGIVSIDNEECLNEGTSWTVDIHKKEISFDPKGISHSIQWDWGFHHEESEPTKPISVNFDHIRRVGAGIAAVLEEKRAMQKELSQSDRNYHSSPCTKRWSINIKGESILTF